MNNKEEKEEPRKKGMAEPGKSEEEMTNKVEEETPREKAVLNQCCIVME